MKHCIILDKLGKCKGCEYSVPGPTKLVTTSQCTWCERNPYLITELSDNYMKLNKNIIVTSSAVPDDSDKVKDKNDTLLKQWGVFPKSDKQDIKKDPKNKKNNT